MLIAGDTVVSKKDKKTCLPGMGPLVGGDTAIRGVTIRTISVAVVTSMGLWSHQDLTEGRPTHLGKLARDQEPGLKLSLP